MDDNKNKPMGWPILYTLATLAGVAVLAILKACGIISMSCGYFLQCRQLYVHGQ